MPPSLCSLGDGLGLAAWLPGWLRPRPLADSLPIYWSSLAAFVPAARPLRFFNSQIACASIARPLCILRAFLMLAPKILTYLSPQRNKTNLNRASLHPFQPGNSPTPNPLSSTPNYGSLCAHRQRSSNVSNPYQMLKNTC